MIPYNASLMFDAIVAKVLAPGAPRSRGWDASDPAGCWTHDRPKGMDYCQGFKLFDVCQDARDYAAALDGPFSLSYDTAASRWAVEPITQLPGC